MIQELSFLLLAIGIGIVGGLVFLVPTILWRLIRKKPIFPKDKKYEVSKTLFVSIVFIGGFAIFCFYTGTPLLAVVALLFMCLCIRALIVYKRNERRKVD